MRPAVPAVLALGANLGDRAATIRSAVEALGSLAGVRVLRVSGLYETPALKLTGVDHDAPAYLNAVALIETTLLPHTLLDAVNGVENDFGRVRDERWGDRTLDVDIVDYDGRESHDERLTLPHPRAAERGFVLVPWLDADNDARLTGHGRVADLAARAADRETVVPYATSSVPGSIDEVAERSGERGGAR
ncbi:2-amino-4-hydroxy-6-hydroxymethyldihydropteridine diphosphokinase [Leifsonia sp. NPDC058292]|uniref:2-amino-4-hydroxy-6- hydroxymethyldihydropteridine diphosphokinase n=1 Tax=Leifsonia sp. NPDC058292 TaxID=3346428 RepID=UPI0036DEEC75